MDFNNIHNDGEIDQSGKCCVCLFAEFCNNEIIK